MKLYTYYRSSASYRLRIALNLKGIDYDPVYVHLREGEHRAPEYLELNPQGLVPALEDGGEVFIQSPAILEYLEEAYPEPPLMPESAAARAQVRAMAQIVACEIHPLNNLRVLKYLKSEFGQEQEAVDAWYRHWVSVNFEALEALVARFGSERHCFGEAMSLADVYLVPQMYNARRFDTDLTPFPNLLRIDNHLQRLEAFARAAPEVQPDAG